MPLAHNKNAKATSHKQNIGGVRICLVEIKRRKQKIRWVHLQRNVIHQQKVVDQKQQETQPSLVATNLVQQEHRLSRNINLHSKKKRKNMSSVFFNYK